MLRAPCLYAALALLAVSPGEAQAKKRVSAVRTDAKRIAAAQPQRIGDALKSALAESRSEPPIAPVDPAASDLAVRARAAEERAALEVERRQEAERTLARLELDVAERAATAATARLPDAAPAPALLAVPATQPLPAARSPLYHSPVFWIVTVAGAAALGVGAGIGSSASTNDGLPPPGTLGLVDWR